MLFICHSFRYLFDWKNQLGYLFVIASQYIAIDCCLIFVSCIISFGVENTLWAFLTIEDIKRDLKLIKGNASAKENRSLSLNHLGDFIQNHLITTGLSVSSLWFHACSTKWTFSISFSRFVSDFSDVHQLALMVVFVWGLVTICISMLLFQMQLEKVECIILNSLLI